MRSQRERDLRELVRKNKRPVALFVDEVHDLNGNTPAAGFALHASSPHSVTLMQLRFASFAVVSLWRDLHTQGCAHAGRTSKKAARRTAIDAIFGQR